ncbi:MAG: C69 family dipeptidase [Synergistaceae bacterium]|nr:C69 family dipeptidase [Synergistaceae bacterium]
MAAGRKASASGQVIVGHNEDNRGELIMRHHYIPAGSGATKKMPFEKGSANVPRTGPTLGFFWTETLRPAPGESFGDSFINETGLVVVSNNCFKSKEDAPDLTDGGIGWGLRRLVAERARSARDAVSIASELLLDFGYRGSGRSYTFADEREAWVFQAVNGRHFAARRVPDDHVMINPNHYSIRELNLDDPENYLASPGLVEYALKRGWYSPTRPGRHDDFDFADAFLHPDYVMAPMNIARCSFGFLEAAGVDIGSGARPPFSLRPAEPVTLSKVASTLACHCERAHDLDENGELRESPHESGNFPEDSGAGEYVRICNGANRESIIVELREDPDETVVWSCFGSPCTLPMTPQHLGAKAIPTSFESVSAGDDGETPDAKHFTATSAEVGQATPEIWSAYRALAGQFDADYSRRRKETASAMDDLRRAISASHNEFESAFPHSREQFFSQASTQAGIVLDAIRNILKTA